MHAREIAVVADTVRLVVEYMRICMTRFFPQPLVNDTTADKIVLHVYERIRRLKFYFQHWRAKASTSRTQVSLVFGE